MGKRLAIVIGAAALGVIALGAQTAAAAPQVVKYDTQLGMYAERGGLYDGYVKSEARKCTEGRRVVLYKARSGADRKFATTRSVGGWWEVDTDRVVLPRTGGLAYAKVARKVGDGFVCRADRSETRGLFVPPRHQRVGTAQATQRHHHRHHAPRPPATTLTKVTVRANGATHRLVRVTAGGPRLTYVEVCDLTTWTCVKATHAFGIWVARLPAQDPKGPYAVGIVGRSAGGYVTGHYVSDPPPDIPPIVNIG